MFRERNEMKECVLFYNPRDFNSIAISFYGKISDIMTEIYNFMRILEASFIIARDKKLGCVRNYAVDRTRR